MVGSSRLVRRRLAMAQEAAEQPALALARNEIDVADEFGAALAPLKYDLAAVKGLKLGAMADADDRGLGQLPGHQFHHLVLALFIECRGLLIEHADVGVMQAQPREGRPLLCATLTRPDPRPTLLALL